MINKYLSRLLPLLFFIAAVVLAVPTVLAQQLESDNFAIASDELMVGSLNGESTNFNLIAENSPLTGSLESDGFSQLAVMLGVSAPTPTPAPSQSCNETCNNNSPCSGGLVCYRGRCRSNLDLKDTSCPSDTSTSTSTTTTTTTPTPTPVPITGFFGGEEEEELPSQLFDISLELDDNTISDITELVARVIFTSFGTEPTLVEMTFIILNEIEEELYRSQDSTVVQTELVFPKVFSDVDTTFEDGKYTLVLKTLYNDNVEDEFRAEFTIGEKAGFNLRFYLFALLVTLGISGIIIFLRKKKSKESKKLPR